VTVLPSLRNDSGITRLAVALGAAGLLLVGGTGALLLSGGQGPLGVVTGPSPTPAPTVGVQFAGVDHSGTTVPWSQPLAFSVTDGTITSVTATGPGGAPLPGTLTPTRWTSLSAQLPDEAYTVTAVVKDQDGKSTTVTRTYRASAATSVLHANLSPGDGEVVGVGQPLIVRFDHSISGPARRLAVLARLHVTTTPAVVGAWRWYNGTEVHYRPEHYWKSGTKVELSADLRRLRVPSTMTWGSSRVRHISITIGKDYESVVDVTAHIMTVRLDGTVIRTIKVSTGRDKYPTKGGVHIVLTREKVHTYDSSTVGIPTASPDGYYEQLPWSMRISNGGAFVHANPATVRVQGVTNVSHGCVNTSVADAEWFYYHSQLGDIVDIIHAAVPPTLWDAGMFDWNYSWATWKDGNLDG
jgi:lipoprotein-anchoring transpeptidase ErfK/SrfK